jgi:hypothetical protein
VRVPEDYQDLDGDPARHPAWFLLRPIDHEGLRLQQRTVELVLQARPPEIDAQIQAGLFEWEEYQPQGTWRARTLLIPRTANHPVPARARAAVFAPVAANRVVRLPVLAQPGRTQVAPTLIYVGRDAPASDVSVDIDGTPVAATRLFSARTQLRLPPLRVGERRLHISTTAQGRWWINYTAAGDGAQLLRQGLRLDDEPLHFEYQKQGDEEDVLSAALYCTRGERAQLYASIDGSRTPDLVPRSDWTFMARSFDIDPGAPRAIPVLDTPDGWATAGQVFFLPLGADLPAGSYRIALHNRSADPCYLNLHRITAGQLPLRRLYREGDLTVAGEVP